MTGTESLLLLAADLREVAPKANKEKKYEH